MAYLSEDDYTLNISLENLNEILEQASLQSQKTPEQVRLFAESYAQAFVASKLGSRYNMPVEFSKDSSDTGRSMLLIMVVIDLVLCTIHKTINPRDIPELRTKACEAAVAWLNEVRDGSALIDVPLVSSYEVRSFIDSQEKFISKEFTDSSLRYDS